jgi:acyl-CoA dehydrogenase
MRSVGRAQRAPETMSRRGDNRTAFGCRLADRSSLRQDVMRSFFVIEQARPWTRKADDMMDKQGNQKAKDLIAAIKAVAPATPQWAQMARTVIDRVIQAHDGMGDSDDTDDTGWPTSLR